MFERFTKDARAVVEQALEEARALGSPTVEAEHLLLALARRGATTLTHEEVLDALESEQRRSLAAAGVQWDVPRQALPGGARPRFGTSSKLALSRALPAAVERGERRLAARHVLAGVLRAEVGTVPRALEGAGIGRDELAT